MGEIADLMIDGMMCATCGVFFVAEHGHPVLCQHCYDEHKRTGKREEIPLATEKCLS